MPYIAEPTVAPAGSEIKGRAVLDWVDNLAKETTEPVFRALKLNPENIDPDGWYSLDIIAQLYDAIHQSDGGDQALVAMGKASAPAVVEMMDFTSIENFIDRSRDPFLASIRKLPDEYGFIVEQKGPQHYELTNNTIVPNAMIYGYLWGVMAELRNYHTEFKLMPIKNYEGGTVGATFSVEWE